MYSVEWDARVERLDFADLDDTLLCSMESAYDLGFGDEYCTVRGKPTPAEVTALYDIQFAGLSVEGVLRIAKKVPLRKGARQLVKTMRDEGSDAVLGVTKNPIAHAAEKVLMQRCNLDGVLCEYEPKVKDGTLQPGLIYNGPKEWQAVALWRTIHPLETHAVMDEHDVAFRRAMLGIGADVYVVDDSEGALFKVADAMKNSPHKYETWEPEAPRPPYAQPLRAGSVRPLGAPHHRPSYRRHLGPPGTAGVRRF